jgi:hypothetical protein
VGGTDFPGPNGEAYYCSAAASENGGLGRFEIDTAVVLESNLDIAHITLECVKNERAESGGVLD